MAAGRKKNVKLILEEKNAYNEFIGFHTLNVIPSRLKISEKLSNVFEMNNSGLSGIFFSKICKTVNWFEKEIENHCLKVCYSTNIEFQKSPLLRRKYSS